ncbi:hypothetical protein H5410_055249, partial [Solanum commersonii]
LHSLLSHYPFTSPLSFFLFGSPLGSTSSFSSSSLSSFNQIERKRGRNGKELEELEESGGVEARATFS